MNGKAAVSEAEASHSPRQRVGLIAVCDPCLEIWRGALLGEEWQYHWQSWVWKYGAALCLARRWLRRLLTS